MPQAAGVCPVGVLVLGLVLQVPHILSQSASNLGGTSTLMNEDATGEGEDLRRTGGGADVGRAVAETVQCPATT